MNFLKDVVNELRMSFVRTFYFFRTGQLHPDFYPPVRDNCTCEDAGWFSGDPHRHIGWVERGRSPRAEFNTVDLKKLREERLRRKYAGFRRGQDA